MLPCARPLDGRQLAIGSEDMSASVMDVWLVQTGERLHHLERLHSKGVCSVEFSPDGKLLALGSEDKTVSIVDSASGERLRVLEGLQLEQLQPLVLEAELTALGDERPGALPALPVAMSLG